MIAALAETAQPRLTAASVIVAGSMIRTIRSGIVAADSANLGTVLISVETLAAIAATAPTDGLAEIALANTKVIVARYRKAAGLST